ncbi:hypothetical protein GE061_020130 [Apolygus lucorum]|uniref:Uncharacterized protein n=1 Tax=Apolygus lucorum TaxID=248454 RepID=A0A8S9WMK0_APOLU|nr:hypothetical protein GE061_020130 [Apolygus lucorum]
MLPLQSVKGTPTSMEIQGLCVLQPEKPYRTFAPGVSLHSEWGNRGGSLRYAERGTGEQSGGREENDASSIIICLLIEGLYEWLDEKYTFFILYKKFNFLVKELGFFV